MTKSFKEIQEALAKPFDISEVKMREQQVSYYGYGKFNIVLLAYLDARLVQDRLDEVLGMENWSVDTQKIEGVDAFKTKITVFCNDKVFYKEDVGTYSNAEPIKGGFSDSLKRAAVHLGIGRYLYSLPVLKGMNCRVIKNPWDAPNSAVLKLKGNQKADSHLPQDMYNQFKGGWLIGYDKPTLTMQDNKIQVQAPQTQKVIAKKAPPKNDAPQTLSNEQFKIYLHQLAVCQSEEQLITTKKHIWSKIKNSASKEQIKQMQEQVSTTAESITDTVMNEMIN